MCRETKFKKLDINGKNFFSIYDTKYLQYIEWCVSYLLPRIVTKLGSPKITIRRITNQMLIAYLKLQPGALNTVQVSTIIMYD